MKTLEDAQWRYLESTCYDATGAGRQPAIVFDMDDTTLWSYDMEDVAMKLHFDPVLQNEWIQDQRFPAPPGMVDFVYRTARMGFSIFGITGRSASQNDASLTNLTKVGYTPLYSTVVHLAAAQVMQEGWLPLAHLV